jgi:hypothetical protein
MGTLLCNLYPERIEFEYKYAVHLTQLTFGTLYSDGDNTYGY